MKVTIVGAGAVGATCADNITRKGMVHELVLLDIKEDYADPAWDFQFPRWFDRWTQMSEFVEYRDLDGKLYTVDFLLRAESLEKDFEQVRDYLKFYEPLPDISMHQETTDYRQHYTDNGAECVYKIYARDIIKYKYSF